MAADGMLCMYCMLSLARIKGRFDLFVFFNYALSMASIHVRVMFCRSGSNQQNHLIDQHENLRSNYWLQRGKKIIWAILHLLIFI